ncbi:hypothetical protein [Novipirellula artificiosorum]|uniref:hypothetical protein n=1 Tax=Novipirellula artificiosorum TaxID=2528016 RepID=UPI0011B4C919|nr:hypothetical protein [Novipirellula artificiosorum]
MKSLPAGGISTSRALVFIKGDSGTTPSMQIAHVIVRDVHFTQGKAGYNEVTRENSIQLLSCLVLDSSFLS